jgi:hypothetical protein
MAVRQHFDRTRSLPAGRVYVGEVDEHQGIAPCIPVWKTGVYLSTLMLVQWNSARELHPYVEFHIRVLMLT